MYNGRKRGKPIGISSGKLSTYVKVEVVQVPGSIRFYTCYSLIILSGHMGQGCGTSCFYDFSACMLYRGVALFTFAMVMAAILKSKCLLFKVPQQVNPLM